MFAKRGNCRLGKAVANIDRGSDGSEAGYVHTSNNREMGEIIDLLRPLAAERDGNRDCSRSNRKRHG